LHLVRLFAFRGRLFEFVDVRAGAAGRFFAICEKIEGRAPPAWLWEAVRRIAARFLHNRDESDPHRAGMAAFEAIQ